MCAAFLLFYRGIGILPMRDGFFCGRHAFLLGESAAGDLANG
jgi:hypothetical protein